MSEREMELSEYIKTMRPERIRKLLIENGRLVTDREAMKRTIAAISSDNVAMTKQLAVSQTKCTQLSEELRQLRTLGRSSEIKKKI